MNAPIHLPPPFLPVYSECILYANTSQYNLECVWVLLCIPTCRHPARFALLHHVWLLFPRSASEVFHYVTYQRHFSTCCRASLISIEQAVVYSWDGLDGGGDGGGGRRSFAFSAHCLVNEPESGYCRLSFSGLDSAVPCLIDISFPSVPTQTPHTSFHIQPYY